MLAPAIPWAIDPDDPRAPPEDVWDALSPAERKRIVDGLPSEFPFSEALPPEGDPHFNAKMGARAVLGGYFARIGRRVYLACELPIYYPGEKMFAPDVIAVLDVETHEREKWVVKEEGKGLDFVVEVLVSGSRRKDLKSNVERYARLGIAEYFVFDRGRLRLFGYRLPAPTSRVYQPILPQGGRYASQVLGLDLRIEGNKLRFFHGMAAIPEATELIASLERMLDEGEARAVAAEERAAEEARLRAEAERLRVKAERLRVKAERLRVKAERRGADAERRGTEAERKLAEALAEIERLKGQRGGRE